MADLGIDIAHEYSKPVTPEALAWATLIIPMQRDHGYELAGEFPDIAAKIHFLETNVPDPYCRPLAEYREKRDALKQLLMRFADTLTRSECRERTLKNRLRARSMGHSPPWAL
jgi:protein-tyrosine-phosphatase